VLESGIFRRAFRIFMSRPLEFSAAGALAVAATMASAGFLAGPALGGIVAMALKRTRDEPVHLSDLLKGFESFTATIPIGLAVGSMVLLGSLLFVVPGLVLGGTYAMALPAAMDRGLRAGEALAAARRLAGRDLLSSVILFTGLCVIGLAGTVLMLAGLCVTVPVAAIALTLAYLESAPPAAETQEATPA
jgi:uncharacterized membrane protein